MPPSDPSIDDPFPAARRWAEQLARWGIPPEIVARAPESPWHHDTSTFAVDDRVLTESTSARWAREVLPPEGGSVLDVGCGGGRSSLVLAPPANELIGVDTDDAMLESFTRSATAAGIARRTVLGRWPEIAPIVPAADVVVCHHVLYDVADLAPFLLALTDHARLAVVVEIPVRHPLAGWSAAWKHFWNLERPVGPTDADVVAVLRELGLDPEVAHGPRPERSRAASDERARVTRMRRRLCLTEDRDDELSAWLVANPIEAVSTVATLRWPGEAQL